MFTTKCYVKVKKMDDRLYVSERLREIGYRRSFESRERNNPYFITRPAYITGPVFEQTNGYIASFQKLNPESIDCGTNIKLFLALAALRDDSDINQLFIVGEGSWAISQYEKVRENPYENNSIIPIIPVRKATPAELIDHFKTK